MSKTIIESQSVLSVSELTFEIKKKLESNFAYIKVKGEISSLKNQSSGHIYFTLKDASAQISAVLFAGNAKSLRKLPKDGDQVILEGELSVYPPRGGYQIIVRSLSYDGVGDLLLKLHQLKLELKDLGYFESSRKKALPIVPKIIGVVTSPTGAVIQDIINVLKRRLHSFHLILNPVKVQGDGASDEIAKAIDDFNKYQLADVLIVGRGGGSIEDLWAFNERVVADAIFRSKIPIISAVGHETDFSIADFVADVRAPTPSAAAEIVSKESSKIHEEVQRAKNRLAESLKHILEISYQKVDDSEERIKSNWKNLIYRQKTLLKTKRAHLESLLPSKQVFMQKNKLLSLKKQFNRIHEIISKKRDALRYISEHLFAIHPKTTLKKGYCICFRENKDSAIIRAKDVTVSENLSLLFFDGEIITQTKEVKLTNE
jgi:exodeoxyribonuclease VII large subunit